ncbi:class A beta-lactamase-related serine hydrolase [Paraflavitalea soli]|uniref:Class A beta-lactamase-related serine hydrolase n=1 Tax=Paraflavitalea soli TaxID=2315862 RepID=A0A3B7MUN8_9BACT|nr:serine hydrolase domain-containing protein [Paraflavitalea soli]AXY75345.1 class A beta-lactamase-related serine hydrolase [Paraflavitalea soli]
MRKPILAILPVLLIASAFTWFPTPADHHIPPPIINAAVKSRIDATLKSFPDSGKIAGVSALIFEKGKEVYYNAFGYADREAKLPMDRNTIVRIFSMTKPVTGVALMTLYEKGAFQLDDPLSKYAPEFANMKVYKGVDASGNLILEPAKRPITIRDLTRHTAGFAGNDIPALAALVKKADVTNPANTLTEMATRLASLPLEFHPGDQWAYGISVDVQAYVVERISGKPFDQYLQETIFDPLKMVNTHYLVPEADRKRFAALYNRSDAGVLTRVPDEQANFFNTKEQALKPGGWGLTTTLDDYMKFIQMLVNKGAFGKTRILKPATVQLMATNQLSDTVSKRMWLPSKGRVGFGIDFAVRTQPPANAAENNGIVGEYFWDGAASTMFWIDPVNELTAVLFTQLVPFDKVKLHKSFRDAVYGPYVP